MRSQTYFFKKINEANSAADSRARHHPYGDPRRNLLSPTMNPAIKQPNQKLTKMDVTSAKVSKSLLMMEMGMRDTVPVTCATVTPRKVSAGLVRWEQPIDDEARGRHTGKDAGHRNNVDKAGVGSKKSSARHNNIEFASREIVHSSGVGALLEMFRPKQPVRWIFIATLRYLRGSLFWSAGPHCFRRSADP